MDSTADFYDDLVIPNLKRVGLPLSMFTRFEDVASEYMGDDDLHEDETVDFIVELMEYATNSTFKMDIDDCKGHVTNAMRMYRISEGLIYDLLLPPSDQQAFSKDRLFNLRDGLAEVMMDIHVTYCGIESKVCKLMGEFSLGLESTEGKTGDELREAHDNNRGLRQLYGEIAKLIMNTDLAPEVFKGKLCKLMGEYSLQQQSTEGKTGDELLGAISYNTGLHQIYDDIAKLAHP